MGRTVWLVATAAALVVAAGSPALQAQTPPRVITVVMTSYRFEPSAIPLAQGERVVLQLVNQDQHGRNHNLETPLFVKTPLVVRGEVFADKDKGDVRFVAVAPGRQAEVEFTAPDAGTYPFICSIPGHAARGQTGSFTVTAPQ